MKIQRCIASAIAIVMSASLSGCFFFYVPGSVTTSVSDAVTGEEGENCVSDTAKVGDPIKLPDGRMMTIKSLSGKSNRCQDSALPVRALLVPPYQPKARIMLSAAWEPIPITDAQKAKDITFHAINRIINSSLLLGSVQITQTKTLYSVASERVQAHIKSLANPTNTLLHEIACSGHKALQIDITGIAEGGKTYVFVDTFIQGDTEIVGMSTWTTTENFSSVTDTLRNACNYVAGI